jgi:hypothetical protein
MPFPFFTAPVRCCARIFQAVEPFTAQLGQAFLRSGLLAGHLPLKSRGLPLCLAFGTVEDYRFQCFAIAQHLLRAVARATLVYEVGEPYLTANTRDEPQVVQCLACVGRYFHDLGLALSP